MRKRGGRAILALALVAGALVAAGGQSAGQTPPPAGLYIADAGVNGAADGKIVRVDPANGNQVVVSQGSNLVDPSGLTFGPDGSLYVADANGVDAVVAVNGPGRIVKVNASTGAQSVLTQAANLQDPVGIAFVDGMLYVADADATPAAGRIVTVNPTTGAQNVLTQGNNLPSPIDLVAENGSLLVSNLPPSIVRVNKTTGSQSVVSAGTNLITAGGLARGAGNDLYVSDGQSGPLPAAGAGGAGAFVPGPAAGKIVRIDRTNGSQTVLSSAVNLVTPTGLVFTPNPTVWAADSGATLGATADGRVVKVDTSTGSQSVVTIGTNLVNPLGMVLFPPPGGPTPPGGNAPAFSRPTCGATVAIPVLGSAALAGTVAVSASDADAGQQVSLTASGLPAWATFAATAGNPATGTITANPTLLDWVLGLLAPASTATLTATDNGSPSRSATCAVTMRVNLIQGSPI